MKKTIVLADRGRLRVLRITEDDLSGAPVHLQELTDKIANKIPDRIADVVTDQQGRFGRGGASGREPGAAVGERHGLESEMERQYLVNLARQIDEAVSHAAEDGGWILAAPQAFLKQLEEKLSSESRRRLLKTVPGDLTKLPLKDLEKRFL